MLHTRYNYNNFAQVVDLGDFYSAPLPEMNKIKALVGAIKLLFSLPDTYLNIEVAIGERVYKFTMLTQDVHKLPFGWFVYMPLENRLDLYVAENPYSPTIQWLNKKPVTKAYSMLFDKAGIDSRFKTIVNIL